MMPSMSFRWATAGTFALLVGLIAPGVWAGDAPEISRSAGDARTVVVLWPRVAPRSNSAVSRSAAYVVQGALASLATSAFPGWKIDVRPEPERVCPRAGCVGPSVGAVLIHHQQGCAVAALVAPGGVSPQQIVPWAGSVVPRIPQVRFREPAESFVTVMDFARCDRLSEPLKAGSAAVLAAMAQVGGAVLPVVPQQRRLDGPVPVIQVPATPSETQGPVTIPVPPAQPVPPSSGPVPSGWEG